MEAEKLAPQNAPLADALASKVDLYDLVPEVKQKRTSSIYLKKPTVLYLLTTLEVK